MPSPAQTPLLSVSLIARDEALRLPAFLDGLAGLEAEIVVLDTGSRDDTAAVAQAGGCAVHSFAWCDDFAAARNAALAHCHGAWILSLDADERLAREDHAALRGLLQGPQDCCYRFITRNYTNDASSRGFTGSAGDPHSDGFPGWFPSAKVRLFPNVPGIAWEGVVHELIGPSLERHGIRIVNTAIPIHHYPLLHCPAARHREKQERYLALGEKKLAANPTDPKAHHELGDQLIDLGRVGPALRAYREAVRLDPSNPLWLKDLGSALLVAGHLPQAVQALRLSAERDPSSADCWRNLGIAQAQSGDWEGARQAFTQAHTREPSHPESTRYLAIAHESCGDSDGALALLEPLLRLHPGHEQGAALYLGIMEAQGRRAEAERFLAGVGRGASGR